MRSTWIGAWIGSFSALPVALKNPELVQQAVDAYGDKIAVGIDAKQGMVATEGWTEDSQMDFIDLAKAMEKMGVATIIYTDIGRDGTSAARMCKGWIG